jgi:hypothetical protein
MDVPICPEWWPQMIWKLHIPPKVIGGPGPSPVNYPPAIDHIMSAMLIHTASYLLQDNEVAQQIRKASVSSIVNMAQKMGDLHDQALKQNPV